MVKIISSLLLVAIAIFLLFIFAYFLGLLPITQYLSKYFTQESLNFFMLISNFIVIVIMVLAILFSHESSKEQILTIKDTTMRQIKTIKRATQNHIDKIEETTKRSKKALLSAFLLEYKENHRNIKEIISYEKQYADNTEQGKIPQNIFSFEAYQANLNNVTIDNPELLDKIVQVYSGLKLFQSFIAMAKAPMLSRSSCADYLRTAIDMMKENLIQIENIYEEILEYKKHYEQ